METPPVSPTTPTINPDEVKILEKPSFLPPGYNSWCDWAWANYLKALQGMVGSSKGVSGYGIGTRWVRYNNPSEQLSVIGWWNKMIAECCGTAPPLPPWLTGTDTAFRGVPRDV